MAEKYFKQPGVMTAQQHFAQLPAAEIQRSKFDRSSAHKTTFDAGQLVPVFLDEVLPGDTFHMSATTFTRLATPLKPFMDNVYIDVHFFFVPARLTWQNWQKFMGERVNPDDDPNDYTIPTTQIDLTTLEADDVACYFGLPPRPGTGDGPNVNALPFRAYALVWNEWYRNQNLQDSIAVPLDDGPDDWNAFKCLSRQKRPDYFTSCLPWPQKGDPVVIPLGDVAPVELTSAAALTVSTVDQGNGTIMVGGASSSPPTLGLWSDTAKNPAVATTLSGATSPSQFHAAGAYADLAEATAITINDLRTSFQIQRMLERDARGGTRYIELILSHFGVHSDDARLQRPEYLGGGTSRLNINPIAATVATESEPQANLAAIGTGVVKGGFQKSFTEHGYIIGIASVRADLTYQQGIEKIWLRETRNDFYWPTFAHLGEQAVTGKELFYSASAYDDAVFGYQERYGEYRYKNSRITGLMNSGFATNLDYWHLSQDFATPPPLNDSFIKENPPIDRVIAVPSEPQFIADFWFQLTCDRPMPVYSVPGLIDHF